MEKLLTPKEVIAIIPISRAQLHSLAHKGKWPGAIRIGCKWFFHSDAVERVRQNGLPTHKPRGQINPVTGEYVTD